MMRALGSRGVHLVLLLLAYVLAAWLVFRPMLVALHGHWTTVHDLDAGYLLLAVAIYVLWRTGTDSRGAEHSASERRSPGWLAGRWLPALAALLFLSMIALAGLTFITANKAATLALLVCAFAPLALWVWGGAIADGVLRAVAILFMATPAWFVLVPALQALTADAVNGLLSRGSWPIYVENNLIALPTGRLEIAQGCAGLKFLQTALALTLIEGFMARRSWRAMFVIGLVSAVLAVLSNWLRVVVITLLALYLGQDNPWVADHNWVGWVLFVLILGPLFYVLGAPPDRGSDASGDAVLAASPNTGQTRRHWFRAGALLVAGFTAGALLLNAAQGDASARVGASQLEAAREFCLESADGHPAPAEFAGAQLQLDCALGKGRYMSLRGYLRESQEREVINPLNRLIPDVGALDFAVTQNRVANRLPGLHTHRGTNIAYGYYATGAWHAAPAQFKLRSLARPLVPGPVFALVIIEPSGNDALSRAGLEAAFQEVAAAISAARDPEL